MDRSRYVPYNNVHHVSKYLKTILLRSIQRYGVLPQLLAKRCWTVTFLANNTPLHWTMQALGLLVDLLYLRSQTRFRAWTGFEKLKCNATPMMVFLIAHRYDPIGKSLLISCPMIAVCYIRVQYRCWCNGHIILVWPLAYSPWSFSGSWDSWSHTSWWTCRRW